MNHKNAYIVAIAQYSLASHIGHRLYSIAQWVEDSTSTAMLSSKLYMLHYNKSKEAIAVNQKKMNNIHHEGNLLDTGCFTTSGTHVGLYNFSSRQDINKQFGMSQVDMVTINP